MRKTALTLTLLFTATLLFAEGTHIWEQSSYDDLEKGTTKGVAIRSEGGLELAPAFAPVFTTPSTYIWAIADDGHGNVFAAAGAPARVYRITPQGQASIVMQPGELQVQALVVAKDGTIYAATSPDGKVYKIERSASGAGAAATPERSSAQDATRSQPEKSRSVPVDTAYKSSVFFDPGTKYIWDLALDEQGQLYVATGDRGEIFRVQKDGQHSLFFESDEAHIRVIAFDPAGNLIAGSDGSGLIYRISPAGQAFVLYSAPKKEITALAIDAEGNIYAAGVGEKRPADGVVQPARQSLPVVNTTITVTATPTGPQTVQTQQSAPSQFPMPSTPISPMPTGGSEIYRIAPDGSPRRMWNSQDDVVYSLSFDKDRLLVGTGNQGNIYAVFANGNSIDLVKASANHVAALARSSSGGLYAATSNLGKLFLLRAAPDAEGTYESDVFDAKIFSKWGRAEVRGSGSFEVFARSGNVDNPDRNWSPWKKVDFGQANGKLEIPPARFVQWKAVLHAGKLLPVVRSVVLNYLPKNVAPEIQDIGVQPGARFQEVPKGQQLEAVAVPLGSEAATPPAPRFDSNVPAAFRDRDSIAVRWTVSDDNDDKLTFAISYRGDNESRWKLLKDGIEEPFYSFSAALLPDGGYELQVTASDAPSHSPAEALTASRKSSRFEVDTTPPQVQNLKGMVEGSVLRVTFRAVDGFTPIQRAEFSVDAGSWQYLEPVGNLSDNRVEDYNFTVLVGGDRQPGVRAETASPDAGDEHVVVVRVYDRFGNMATEKTVVRSSPVKK